MFKIMKAEQFLVFLAVQIASPSFWAGEGVDYVRIA